MIKASIIIPTYNRRKLLEKCLQALFHQTYPSDQYEIILIDDGSTDGTETMVQSLCAPCKLVYVKNKCRIGQPKSRNKGIELAQGEYIIFVDSDIIVIPQFVEEHLKFHQIYGDVIVNGELIYISSFHEIGKKRKSLWDISFSSFNTANVSVKKKFLQEVGGFDENLLPYGWQDVELGYRLKKMGLKKKKNRKALGYHFRKWGDCSDLPFLKEKEFMRGISGAIYYKKHPCLKVKLSVKANPLFAFAFLGKWLEENSRGKNFFNWIKDKKIRWLNAACMKLIICHYYLKGYNREIKREG